MLAFVSRRPSLRRLAQIPISDIDETYAVGALSLRQSGTLRFNGVRFFRATRGKTAHEKIGTYLAAADTNVAL